jgi:hypothetical protein
MAGSREQHQLFGKSCVLASDDALALEFFNSLRMVREMLPHSSDSEVSQKQTIGDHESEHHKAQSIRVEEHQPDWNKDEKQHQPVQENTHRRVFLPPPVRLSRPDFQLRH